jgi:hypothetical protein
MNFITPTPKNKYMSSSKYRTDIRLLLSEFWKQFRDAVLERINRFLNPLPPYVSQYSLRTEIDHAQIRTMLADASKHCQHLKGNRFGAKSREFINCTDYNVSIFKFIDGKMRIRCNTCGQKWFPGDEHWEAAMVMVRQSSNHMASSETFLLKRGDSSLPSEETLHGKTLRGME